MDFRRLFVTTTPVTLMLITPEIIFTATLVADALILIYRGTAKSTNFMIRLKILRRWLHAIVVASGNNNKDYLAKLWQLQMHFVILISKEQS
ncbi:MAG TPA: hypothetical protein VFI73_10395 [Candidatus Nitrosopolaris sp.]|nr:hypothetical protein [Candidatus Nitrosopolaris sp.]